MHVIVKEGLANGRLAAEPPETVRRVAAGRGLTADTVALAAVLARPWADTVLSGAVSVQQIRTNLAAESIPLEPGELRDLSALAMSSDAYWQARAALPWN